MKIEPPFPEPHMTPPGEEHRLRPRPRYEAKEYRPAGKLEGKVALITGGDSGIGRAVAVLYAREGADVAIVYLSEDQDAKETARLVKEAGGRCLLIPGDVGDAGFCTQAVDRTVRELGTLDILVNNAGEQHTVDALEDLTEGQWRRTFATNIDGYFFMAKAAVPHVEAIINTGSIAGLEGIKGLLDYSATKGAIHAFTKSLAQMLVDRGIRVNCVAPGPVWTPLNPADDRDVTNFGKDQPMGRPAQPEELAPAYVFFASHADSSYISGEVLAVLGGQTRAA